MCMNEYYEQARNLVAQMTLDEKISFGSGASCWDLPELSRLGILTMTMMDGPHGLRKQIGATDNLGIGESIPAVCFPTASALACSFDRDLVEQVGRAIGEECVSQDVQMILGPGINQKRSPLCGRNFEYFSEDPIVSGELGIAMVNGVQSTGTGTSLKHFAVNNQEKRRMTVDALVDERTLFETYLRSFEIVVKKSNPTTVMCAYNKLNGVYCSENKFLLTDILRDNWGFNGLVVSDWGAVHDRVMGMKAGLDLEMPGNHGFHNERIKRAIANGQLTEVELDKTTTKVVEMMLRAQGISSEITFDQLASHEIAVDAASQSMVLLKNEGNILPINGEASVAIIGEFAKKPRFQGAGSSKINPAYVETPYDSLKKRNINLTYAQGYDTCEKDNEGKLIEEAVHMAETCQQVILFVGLPEGYESEGFDREHMKLPAAQTLLIDEVSKVNKQVVVVLIGGAPVELPWQDNVRGILLAYLSGEGMGEAVVRILLGKVNPSGKLAETWPCHLEDTPSYFNFPGDRKQVEYREGIYVGYKYYERAQVPVNFSFGHGLSYTKFQYDNLQVPSKVQVSDKNFSVSFQVKNIGEIDGKETTFIFVKKPEGKVFFPVKELCEFQKITVSVGQEVQVKMEIDISKIAYYNTVLHDWDVIVGEYEIFVGASSDNLVLSSKFEICGEEVPYPARLEEYFSLANKNDFSKVMFDALYGKEIIRNQSESKRPFTPENTLEDVIHTFVGKIILRYAKKVMTKSAEAEAGQTGMLVNMIREMPFFAMAASGDDMLPENVMLGLVDLLNHKYIAGLKKLVK